jgi:hypothetical protein
MSVLGAIAFGLFVSAATLPPQAAEPPPPAPPPQKHKLLPLRFRSPFEHVNQGPQGSKNSHADDARQSAQPGLVQPPLNGGWTRP